MTIPPAAFRLDGTYVHLDDGPGAVSVEVADDFWQTLGERTELHDGRLITLGHMASDWDHWEMHPAGDELVYLLSGAMELILDTQGGEQVVALGERQAIIVPRGVWHRARISAAGDALFVTRGAGTQHRPVSA
jgi:oxalate decarboxylase/phosphoglucose isomerase-like protein (cupin superfamily)